MAAVFKMSRKEGASLATAAVASILLAVIATIDHVTGYEVALSLFYLVPIVFATSYGGLLQGLSFSLFSAVAWFIVDWSAGHTYSQRFIPFWNASVRLGFFLVTTVLLARLQSEREKERRMARLDGLTGVMNGFAFGEATKAILCGDGRSRCPSVMGYIDLDNFKSVNDTLGHTEGDRVLKMVATVLRESVRSTDFVGRLGGDEFALLLPETDSSGAAAMFKQLHERLLKEAGGHAWPIGFSIGVAVFRTAPSGVDEAIRLADALMYRVKNAGKNNILLEEFG